MMLHGPDAAAGEELKAPGQRAGPLDGPVLEVLAAAAQDCIGETPGTLPARLEVHWQDPRVRRPHGLAPVVE
eukprot:6735323-Lingulodinium_polyedra.AAC.1